MTIHRSTAAVLCGIALATTGCESTPESRGRTMSVAQEQFGEWLDQAGIVVVYPPSEDVRVGDLYAYATAPGKLNGTGHSGLLVSTSRWATLPVLDTLGAEYGERRSWPETPAVFVEVEAAEGNMGWGEPTEPDIFTPDPAPNRLRQVALTGATNFTFEDIDLIGLLPSEAATMITGPIDPSLMNVSMRVGAAESYSVSAAAALDMLLDRAMGADGNPTYSVKPAYRDNLSLLADRTTGRVWIDVLTEVIYARSADIFIRLHGATPHDDKVNADGLTEEGPPPALVAVAQMDDAGDDAGDDGSAEEGDTEADPEDDAVALMDPENDPNAVVEMAAVSYLDPIYGAFLRAQRINEMLSETNANQGPGKAIRFISISDESVSLRRIWQRGIAIGVRGLTLEIDATTGEVIATGTLGEEMRYPPPPDPSMTAAPDGDSNL